MDKNPNLLHKTLQNDGVKSILSSIISIAVGIVFGLIVMILITFVNDSVSVGDAFRAMGLMLKGAFASNTLEYKLTNIGDVIFYSVPLIFTGLSVAIAYKTGLFNIGAPGQYVMGTVGALCVALYMKPATAFGHVMVWLLALLAGAVCGALWAVLPGVLKAFFDINEVIICIMTNWIAANIASWVFKYTEAIHSTENTKGGYLMKNLNNPTPTFGLNKLFPGSYADCGIFIAIIAAAAVWFVLNKTTFGFELRTCGSNKHAAKYAGLNAKRNIILSIAIAGALAGMGAALYFLNPGVEYKYISQYSGLPAYGFNGIASAFLANCNPVGTVFTSVFIRYITKGGDYLVKYGFNRYIADIVVAVIIYLAGFTRIIKEYLTPKKKAAADDAKAPVTGARAAGEAGKQPAAGVQPVSEEDKKGEEK